jgi:predicted Zn finger-like uncharacterized protein
MKFLCPSCKAKYQIADEKVIGRSVKMKCRQCGHVIEIQESVIEASAGVSQPPIPLTSIPAPALTPPPKPRVASRPHAAGAAAQSLTSQASHARTGAVDPQKPTTAGNAAPHRPLHAPAARSPSPPSSGSHSPAPGRAARPSPQSSIGSHTLPRVSPGDGNASDSPPGERLAPRPATARAPVANQVSTGIDFLQGLVSSKPVHAAVPRAVDANNELRASLERSPAGSSSVVSAGRRSGEALAEAFTSAVGVAPAAPGQLVGDEWYVGINDSPIGPIPLTELRARAAQGQVTVDSLVWRDGFEDWKPVRSFPELLAVVEEAISSIYASRAPFRVPNVTADFGPVISLSPPTERQPMAAASVIQAALPVVAASPQVLPVESPSLTPEEIAAVTGHRRSPKGPWIAVAGALALGLAIGFVFFRQAPAAPEIKYVQVAQSASVVAVAAPAPSVETQQAPVVASADAIRASAKRVAGGETKANAEPSAAPQASLGLKGLSGLRALGPQSGPAETGSSSGSSSGQALDSATLQKTVSRYTASVRRSCWQPALDSRAPDAPTVARVSVKIDIAASGNVRTVSSNGDPKGYRGLANCIESRVKNWTFPPSSGATTVNVPFVFAAQ